MFTKKAQTLKEGLENVLALQFRERQSEEREANLFNENLSLILIR